MKNVNFPTSHVWCPRPHGASQLVYVSNLRMDKNNFILGCFKIEVPKLNDSILWAQTWAIWLKKWPVVLYVVNNHHYNYFMGTTCTKYIYIHIHIHIHIHIDIDIDIHIHIHIRLCKCLYLYPYMLPYIFTPHFHGSGEMHILLILRGWGEGLVTNKHVALTCLTIPNWVLWNCAYPYLGWCKLNPPSWFIDCDS